LAGSRSLKTLIFLPSTAMKVVAGRDFVLQVAQDRVVLEQVSQRRRAGQVVDGDKIDVVVAKRGAQNIASNAAEAVDTNLYCHV
jgi:hypothetical protein